MGKCSFFVHFWSKFFLGISGSRLGTGSVLGLWEGEIKRASHTKYGPIVSGGSRNNEEWTMKSLGKKWSFTHNFWHRFLPAFSKKFLLGNSMSSIHMPSFSNFCRVDYEIVEFCTTFYNLKVLPFLLEWCSLGTLPMLAILFNWVYPDHLAVGALLCDVARDAALNIYVYVFSVAKIV